MPLAGPHPVQAYNTWRACGEAVLEVIPDMSVMVSEVGQGAVIPSWVTEFGAGDILIDEDTVEWIKVKTTSF